jgi:hypothetical protein
MVTAQSPALSSRKGVTKIGSSAFVSYDMVINHNSKLTSVTIPESVTEIGGGAFEGCPLTSITLHKSLTTLGDTAFRGTAIRTLALHSGLILRHYDDDGIKIAEGGRGAFEGCKNLTSVTISGGITEIPEGMFFGCTALTSVTLPSTITKINDSAFSSCTALTTITLPSSIKYIGRGAFLDCTALTTITIPEAVKTIKSDEWSDDWGNDAFGGCPKLPLATQAALRCLGYKGSF